VLQPDTLKKLLPQDPRKPFDCGDIDLNNYFLDDSAGHSLYLLSVTYTLEIDSQTVAFFSVLNDRVKKEDSSNGFFRRFKKKLPDAKHYDSYLAVKVARFGVHKDYQGQQIGSEIMNRVKVFFVDEKQKTGCRFITIDAYKDPRVINFYKNNGFDFLTTKDKNDDTRAMFFDLMPIANYQTDLFNNPNTSSIFHT
jgi:GNAT superfamily N-acetyltransferase